MKPCILPPQGYNRQHTLVVTQTKDRFSDRQDGLRSAGFSPTPAAILYHCMLGVTRGVTPTHDRNYSRYITTTYGCNIRH